jgi:hypothetical protein
MTGNRQPGTARRSIWPGYSPSPARSKRDWLEIQNILRVTALGFKTRILEREPAKMRDLPARLLTAEAALPPAFALRLAGRFVARALRLGCNPFIGPDNKAFNARLSRIAFMTASRGRV